jgi:hypothetical protein
MAGLARAFKHAGGRLYAKTEAKEIKGGKSAKIKTQNGITISAQSKHIASDRRSDRDHLTIGLLIERPRESVLPLSQWLPFQ